MIFFENHRRDVVPGRALPVRVLGLWVQIDSWNVWVLVSLQANPPGLCPTHTPVEPPLQTVLSQLEMPGALPHPSLHHPGLPPGLEVAWSPGQKRKQGGLFSEAVRPVPQCWAVLSFASHPDPSGGMWVPQPRVQPPQQAVLSFALWSPELQRFRKWIVLSFALPVAPRMLGPRLLKQVSLSFGWAPSPRGAPGLPPKRVAPFCAWALTRPGAGWLSCQVSLRRKKAVLSFVSPLHPSSVPPLHLSFVAWGQCLQKGLLSFGRPVGKAGQAPR